MDIVLEYFNGTKLRKKQDPRIIKETECLRLWILMIMQEDVRVHHSSVLPHMISFQYIRCSNKTKLC